MIICYSSSRKTNTHCQETKTLKNATATLGQCLGFFGDRTYSFTFLLVKLFSASSANPQKGWNKMVRHPLNLCGAMGWGRGEGASGEVNLFFFSFLLQRNVALRLETQSLSNGLALVWFYNLPFQFPCSLFFKISLCALNVWIIFDDDLNLENFSSQSMQIFVLCPQHNSADIW